MRSVQRTVARFAVRRSSTSAPSVNRYSEVDPALLPEATFAHALKAVFACSDGAAVVVERAASRELIAALAQREVAGANTKQAAAEEDWTCGSCGFVNFASKSRRITCAKCSLPQTPLPVRDAYMLQGERGSGKSVALASVVQWARQAGWITLYVPHAWCIANAGGYVTPSTHFAGMYEAPHGPNELLKAFQTAHGEQLARVPLRFEESKARWKCETLGELLTAALDDKRFDESSAALSDVRAELGAMTEFPVLIAIDEYSAWFAPSTAYYFKQKNLAMTEMITIAALRELGPAGAVRPLARGVIVVADSGSRGAATLEAGHFRKVIPHMPYELKVGNYTSQEFDSALESYKASELMSSELSPADVAALKMATQRNPKLLFDRALQF